MRKATEAMDRSNGRSNKGAQKQNTVTPLGKSETKVGRSKIERQRIAGI